MNKNLYLVVFGAILLTCIQWSSQRRMHDRRSKNWRTSGCGRQKASGLVDIFITVSSLSLVPKNGTVIERQVEINWHQRIPREGDKVGLYKEDPRNTVGKPLVTSPAINHTGGHFRTRVEFPYTYFNLTYIEKTSCLGYWAAYLVGDEVVSSACLQIRPFWMEKNRQFLEHQKLSTIMIPGSHDSGSYSPYMGRSYDALMRYKYTQEEPIFNQLAYGLRYFDFRVGYYPSVKDKFYINHSLFRTEHSLKMILKEVKQFLDTTREIVILDFHHFPVGFENDTVHLEFMNLIASILNTYLIPYNAEYRVATLGKLWQKNKRVLVSYNSKIRSMDSQGVFWPGLPRAWGNKQNPKELKRYFENVFTSRLPGGIWVAMAELTPNSKTIVLHPKLGLRQFADEINRNITKWFRDLYWDKANIVATDYFLGNDLVDIAIEANKMRYFCLEKYHLRHL